MTDMHMNFVFCFHEKRITKYEEGTDLQRINNDSDEKSPHALCRG